MALLNETSEQYYVGTQSMVFDSTTHPDGVYSFTWDTDLKLGANLGLSPYIPYPVIPQFGSWSPNFPYYDLNNFVLETSSDQNTWTEYDGATNASIGNAGDSGYFTVHNNTISFF